MILRALSGPHAGQSREVPAGVDPIALLGQFAEADWQWECDWGSASGREEMFVWARADMVARIMRALTHGRPVRFLGVEYRAGRREAVPGVAGAIEDAIVGSGFHVVVESDDAAGVRIGVGPPEQQTLH